MINFRSSAALLGCVFGVFFASSSANATTYTVDNISLWSSDESVTLSGLLNETTTAGPFILHASQTNGISSNTNIWVFCVDLFHTFSPGSPAGTYTTQNLLDNNNGSAITATQSAEIQYLASLAVGPAGPKLTADQEAATQLAIWKIEYDANNDNISTGLLKVSGNANVNALTKQFIDNAAAAVVGGGSDADELKSQNGHQSFVDGGSGSLTGSVPEPSTWAMMIIGFCGMGFLGYRRNRARRSIRLA